MKKAEVHSSSNTQESDDDEEFFSDESSFYGKESLGLHVFSL